MPFQIVRNADGWILNNEGDVLLKEVDSNEDLWVPQNNLSFTDSNHPCARPLQSDDHENDPTEFEIIHEGDDYSVSNDTTASARNTWSYDHTLELISAVEARYDDMHHVTKRKQFWSMISIDLSSQNINYSDKACQKKWFNLVRTYKSTKDNKKKTGRGPSRFNFYDRLDELLGDSPTNCSPHSIDVSGLSSVSNDGELIDQPSTSTNCTSNEVGRKRKHPTMEYVKIKKQYYEKRGKEFDKREELHKQFLEQSLLIKQEKLQLMKRKLELEERKVNALEKLANMLV